MAKSSEGKAEPTAGAPEEDLEPARAAVARARRVASASTLAAAAAAGLGESPIVGETARSARHSSSHSELSPRQSPQQSQQNLTATVAAKLAHRKNQPVYHTLNLSRRQCFSFFCVLCLLVSNQTDCAMVPFVTPGQVSSNHPR